MKHSFSRLGAWVYRGLLRLFPSDVREDHGTEMVELFRDLVDDACRERGRIGGLLTAIGLLGATPLHAIQAHLGDNPLSTLRGATRGDGFLGKAFGDLSFTVRTLRRSPRFAVMAIAMVALGVGATASMFSVVVANQLRPLPFPEPDRLVTVNMRFESPSEAYTTRWSYREYEAFADVAWGMESVGAWTVAQFSIRSGSNAPDAFPEQVRGEIISAEYLEILGVQPSAGRFFNSDEDEVVGAHPVVILSDALHRRLSGATQGQSQPPLQVGQVVRINGVPLAVVGVMPPGFAGLSGRAQLWIPQAMGPVVSYPGQLETHQHFHNVIARLAPGVSFEEALQRNHAAGRAILLEVEHEDDGDWAVTQTPLAEARIDPADRRAALLLLVAVGLVLAIACANLTNLFLARSIDRQREAAIRIAVGSPRGRIVLQMMMESLTLCVVGAGLGLLLTEYLNRSVVRLSGSGSGVGQLSAFAEPTITWQVVVFTVVISVLISVVASLAPIHATRGSRRAGSALRSREPAGSGSTSGLLVVGQFGITAGLLTGAAVLVTTYMAESSGNIGVDPEGVMTAWVRPPDNRYTEPGEGSQFLSNVLREVGSVPGIESATVGMCSPLEDGCSRTSVLRQGEDFGQDGVSSRRHYIAPEHLETLRIPLLAGRPLRPSDRDDAPRVTLVSQSGAERLWPGNSALGQRVWFQSNDFHPDSAYTVVGVVGDVRYGQREDAYAPDFYTPYMQFSWAYTLLMVRSNLPAQALTAELRQAVARVDGDVPLNDAKPLKERMTTTFQRPRFQATMLGGFSLLALVLASMGIYGLMAHTLGRQRREFAVRLALGAAPSKLRNLILGRGLRLTAAGTAVGVVAAIVATRALGAGFTDMGTRGPAALAGVLSVLALATIGACYLPALKASAVEPASVLRED